jgi:anti-anti-sigma regulatory factor
MRAYVKTLTQSSLLVLCPTSAGRYSLAQALRRVVRGSHRSVWVDCRHITTLPAEALLLLRQCAGQLWQQGGHLVLCHLPEAARTLLATDASQPLAACLLDAEQYGLDCPSGPPPE